MVSRTKKYESRIHVLQKDQLETRDYSLLLETINLDAKTYLRSNSPLEEFHEVHRRKSLETLKLDFFTLKE